jgi:hypothetical protein
VQKPPWWGEKGVIVTIVGETERFAISGVGVDGRPHVQRIREQELEFKSMTPEWQKMERVLPAKAGESVIVRRGTRKIAGKIVSFSGELTADVDLSDGKRPVVQQARIDDLALVFDWKLTEDE